MFISILAFIAAISIAGVAAWFSIVGLIALFPGSATSIAIMAGSLEVGKLVTASWLYRNWKETNLLLKSYLVIAVVVLMVITSLGVFGYLSKSYLANAAPAESILLETAIKDQEIERLTSELQRSQKVLTQMDDAVTKLIDFNRVSGPNGAIAMRESQKQEREVVNQDIARIQKQISDVQREKIALSASMVDVKSKLGPVEYIAKFIYGDDGTSVDKAVQLIILLLVMVFDPLAVLLLIAANQGIYRNLNTNADMPAAPVSSETSSPTEILTYDELVNTLSNKPKRRRGPKKNTSDNQSIEPQPKDTVPTAPEAINTNSKRKPRSPNAAWIKNNNTE